VWAERTTEEEMGGTNFILRIKGQETRLTLQEHDDDDDYYYYYFFTFKSTQF